MPEEEDVCGKCGKRLKVWAFVPLCEGCMEKDLESLDDSAGSGKSSQ